MIPKQLYRGDKRGNSTLPEKYRTEGLLTKFINGGNSAYIAKVGLAESIRVHVAPTDSVERILQSKSSFLSFSSDRDQALYYASEGNSSNVIQCHDYAEKRYLFTIDTSECIPTDDPGIYSLEYTCNQELIQPNALTPDDLIVAKSVHCEFCKEGKQTHRLLLLDVVAFLSRHPHSAKSNSAIGNAQRDSEWLILPVDYLPRLYGFSARIPRSSIWHVEHFLLNTESTHEVTLDGIQGISIDE
jgi:hypothetical protein